MVRAIPVPKSVFNPSTGKWEVTGVDLTPPKKSKATYKPPTHIVFGGGGTVIDTDGVVKERKLPDPWWDGGYRKTPKSWKHQSSRARQYR